MRACLPLAVALAACGPAPLAEPEPFARSGPSLAEVWQIATHNSYWVDRGAAGDAFASGTSERILDQLLFDHARALELDIHKDPAAPGKWRVYHTAPGNGLCDDFAECLAIVRAFHRALPDHEPVTLVVELKELFESNFDAAHDPAALDALLGRELGAALFRPEEIASRCRGKAGGESLQACLAKVGWPSLAALRGRVVVALLGNWDTTGQATADWARYAAEGSAAFAMASSWKLDWSTLPPRVRDLVGPDDLARAAESSALLQIEELGDPRAPGWLARGAIVRMDATDAKSELAAISRRMQLVQTDLPGTQPDDRGPIEPMRPFDGAYGAIAEPGVRLMLGGAEDGRAFAYRQEQGPGSWEATVSFGAAARGSICLRAAAAIGGEPDSASLCARKVSGTASPPEGGKGTPDAERLYLSLVTCRAGSCSSNEIASADRSSGGAGEILALSCDGACVAARSARLVDGARQPVWQAVGAKECFAAPLRYRGIARPASPRHAPLAAFGVAVDPPLHAAELTVVVERKTVDPAPGLLVDLSR